MDTHPRVATLENEVEARVLEGLLEDRGIPHAIVSFHDSVYDGIYQLQKGWGYVMAPAENRGEVLSILAAMRDAPEEIDTEQEPE
jgi:hypothetical protein